MDPGSISGCWLHCAFVCALNMVVGALCGVRVGDGDIEVVVMGEFRARVWEY